jgi:hypothetical protein
MIQGSACCSSADMEMRKTIVTAALAAKSTAGMPKKG